MALAVLTSKHKESFDKSVVYPLHKMPASGRWGAGIFVITGIIIFPIFSEKKVIG